LKNSDFKPFLAIFNGKVNDLWVYVGDGIGVYFGMFLSGESVPGEGRIGWKGVKKLFIDRLGRIKSSSVGCQ
jgi:hypothetical protein